MPREFGQSIYTKDGRICVSIRYDVQIEVDMHSKVHKSVVEKCSPETSVVHLDANELQDLIDELVTAREVLLYHASKKP